MPSFNPYPGGYVHGDFVEPHGITGQSSRHAESFDPKNPRHVLLNDNGRVLGLNLDKIEKIAQQMNDFIQKRQKESPANPASAASQAIDEKLIAKYSKMNLSKSQAEQVGRRITERRQLIVKEYDDKTDQKLESFTREINNWRSENKKVLDFLKGLPANAIYFNQDGKETTAVSKGVNQLRHKLKELKLLDTGSWRWLDKGMKLLHALGYDVGQKQPATVFGGGAKGTPLDVPITFTKARIRELAGIKGGETAREKYAKLLTYSGPKLIKEQLFENLSKAKEKLKFVQKQLAELEGSINKGLEFITGEKPKTESEKKRMIKANRRLSELVVDYDKFRAGLISAKEEVGTAQTNMEELGLLLEPKIHDTEEKLNQLNAALRDTNRKFRRWSKDLSIDDVIPFKDGEYLGVEMRDIPIDYLLFVDRGIKLNKEAIHEFEKNGKKYTINFPTIKVEHQRWGPLPREQVRDYLKSINGRRRLREFYGPAFPDFIKVIDRHKSEVDEERSQKVQNNTYTRAGGRTMLRKMTPAEVAQIRREQHEAMQAVTAEQQYNLIYKRAIESGMSPEYAKNYAKKAMDLEGDKSTPAAFYEEAFGKVRKQEIKQEDYLYWRDWIRKNLRKYSMEEFMYLFFPPKDLERGWTSHEEAEAKKEYYKLRARVEQTDPLDIQTAQRDKYNPDYPNDFVKEPERTSGTKAGWLPHDPSFHRLETPGAGYALSEILDQALQTNSREDLLALRSRLTELFHMTKLQKLRDNEEGLSTHEIDEREEELKKLDYWESFEEDPETKMIQYAHNFIMERYNKFAHPDVTAIPAVNILSEEAEGTGDMPYPQEVEEAKPYGFNELMNQYAEDETFTREARPLTTAPTHGYTPMFGAEERALTTPFRASESEQAQFHTEFMANDADDMATETDINEYRKGKMFF